MVAAVEVMTANLWKPSRKIGCNDDVDSASLPTQCLLACRTSGDGVGCIGVDSEDCTCWCLIRITVIHSLARSANLDCHGYRETRWLTHGNWHKKLISACSELGQPYSTQVQDSFLIVWLGKIFPIFYSVSFFCIGKGSPDGDWS